MSSHGPVRKHGPPVTQPPNTITIEGATFWDVFGPISYVIFVVLIFWLTYLGCTPKPKAKLAVEPVFKAPRCCFCGRLMDCPHCGAANFAPTLEDEDGR